MNIADDQKSFRRERDNYFATTHFEGVYVWSASIPGYAGERQTSLNAFAIQIRLLSNQKMTRIQRRANRQLQSKVFGFWDKCENGKKNSGSITEIDVDIKGTFKSRIIA